jgi:predicted secreted Zn-dependent protease
VRLIAILFVVAGSACVTVAPRERAAVVLPPSVWPQDTTIHWYDIDGDDEPQLRALLDARGPLDSEGNRHDAYTSWYVKWHFPLAQTDEGCTTGPVTTTVRSDITLPRWRAPAGDSPLVKKWRKYLDALSEHESGHREIGFNAAAEITDVLPRLPPQPTCDEAVASANALALQVLEQHRKRDAEYDSETRHGATQGAVFP